MPAVLGLALLAYARGRPVSPSGAPVEAGPAPALVLSDDHGQPFDLAAHRGGVVLVTFGYARCPNVCPATLGALDAVSGQLGDDRGKVMQVFVTLDPARDTPAALRDYLARFDPAPLGLTGSTSAIAAASRAWGVTARPAAGGAFLDHTTLVAVVGPDGRERLRYGLSQLGDPASIAQDIRQLLDAG